MRLAAQTTPHVQQSSDRVSNRKKCLQTMFRRSRPSIPLSKRDGLRSCRLLDVQEDLGKDTRVGRARTESYGTSTSTTVAETVYSDLQSSLSSMRLTSRVIHLHEQLLKHQDSEVVAQENAKKHDIITISISHESLETEVAVGASSTHADSASLREASSRSFFSDNHDGVGTNKGRLLDDSFNRVQMLFETGPVDVDEVRPILLSTMLYPEPWPSPPKSSKIAATTRLRTEQYSSGPVDLDDIDEAFATAELRNSVVVSEGPQESMDDSFSSSDFGGILSEGLLVEEEEDDDDLVRQLMGYEAGFDPLDGIRLLNHNGGECRTRETFEI